MDSLYVIVGIAAAVVLVWKLFLSGPSTPAKKYTPTFKSTAVTPKPKGATSSPSVRKPVPAKKPKVVGPKPRRDADGRPRMLLLFGSQTGTAEDFADQLKEEADARGFDAQTLDLEELEPGDLAYEPFVVFFMATYGEGEPTDNAKDAYEWLEAAGEASSEEPPLAYCEFGVFGLGNSTYEHYNAMGRNVNRLMEELGAKRVLPYGEGDDDGSLEDDFATWKEALWAPLLAHFGMDASGASDAPAPRHVPKVRVVEHADLPPAQCKARFDGRANPSDAQWDYRFPCLARITVNRELHSEASDRSCRHIELELPQGMTYEPGDHLGVYPDNDGELVAAYVERLGYDGDAVISLMGTGGKGGTVLGPCTITQALTQYADLTSLPRKGLLTKVAGFAEEAGEAAELLELAANNEAGKALYATFAEEQRILLDVLQQYPSIQLPVEVFFDIVPKLPARFYSISSSIAAHPGMVHITAVVTEFTTKAKRFHKGVCTTWLRELVPGVSQGEIRIPVFVRTSSFRLPKDGEVPIIMVGPGTGLAPFRGFLQQRKHDMSSGTNLLFFGCRNRDVDYIYREELEAAQAADDLELQVAFSRQGREKVYVQHLMAEPDTEARLYDLMSNEGAHLYVCGDANYMAKDVHKQIVHMYTALGGMTEAQAESHIEKLEKLHRLSKDVWF